MQYLNCWGQKMSFSPVSLLVTNNNHSHKKEKQKDGDAKERVVLFCCSYYCRCREQGVKTI